MIWQQFLLVWFASSCLAQLTNLTLVIEWKVLEYDFPSAAEKQAAIASGEYVPGKGVPSDVAVYYSRTIGGYK